ncbi:hypothetical protein ACJ72_00765 [Emergomyces africanus]|uniref:Uncharacterized protein n=1 Tax=Emergomyces africanus TaxID=1955775 RepID=A0A1B7P793_9EURO|nr:hypothetical protein ACJ72_00765 [Emergomyces africanus]
MDPVISGGPDTEFHDPERVKLLRSCFHPQSNKRTRNTRWWRARFMASLQQTSLSVCVAVRYTTPGRPRRELLGAGKRPKTFTSKSGPSTPVNPIVENTPSETTHGPLQRPRQKVSLQKSDRIDNDPQQALFPADIMS